MPYITLLVSKTDKQFYNVKSAKKNGLKSQMLKMWRKSSFLQILKKVTLLAQDIATIRQVGWQ